MQIPCGLLLLFLFVRKIHLVRLICVCMIMLIMVRERRWSVWLTWNQLNTPTQHIERQPKKSAICHRIFGAKPAYRTVGRTWILPLRNDKPRRRKKKENQPLRLNNGIIILLNCGRNGLLRTKKKKQFLFTECDAHRNLFVICCCMSVFCVLNW